MKKVFSLLLCIILLCGCANTNNTPPPAETVVPEESIIETPKDTPEEFVYLDENETEEFTMDPNVEPWKYTVAEKLYDEFCYYYNHMYDDLSEDFCYSHLKEKANSYISYYAILAADRAMGVRAYKDYLPKSKVEYVRSKREEVNSNLGDVGTGPYLGYSQTGIHYMALMGNAISDSKFAYNAIRDNADETSFMYKMSGVGINIHDIYVEDLSGRNESIDMNIYLYDSVSSPKYKYKQVTEISEQAWAIINLLQREVVPANTTKFKNKSWNAFCYEIGFISGGVIVKSFGETTLLVTHIPEF